MTTGTRELVRVTPWVCLTVALVLTSPGERSLRADQTPATLGDLQKDKAAAKALVKQGDTLIKVKKLAEGRLKYLDASRLVPDPKIEAKIAEADLRISNEIKKHLHDAEKLYKERKYPQAVARLEDAKTLRKDDPAILYNIALAKNESGDKAGALQALDDAVGGVSNEGERLKLRALKSQWETGEKPAATYAPERVDALKDINDQLASGADAEETCQKLQAVASMAQQSPSLLFNLAKCAEDAGKLEEAAALLDRYFKAATNTPADTEGRDNLQAILDIQKQAGPEVMKLYGDADREARAGRHRRAVQALQQAETAAPALPDTQLRLARLFQGRGDVAEARLRYDKYLQMSPTATNRAAVEDEKNALEKRTAEYQKAIAPATERFERLLARYVSDGRPMGYSAAREEFRSIAEGLQQASLMLPLDRNLNLMLGQVYLSGGSYSVARKSFAIAWDAGSPIWFYGTVEDVPGWAGNILTKCELAPDGIRLIRLAQFDKKQKRFVPLPKAGGEDRVGGLLSSYSGEAANVFVLPMASISSVETEDDRVRLTFGMSQKEGAAAMERQIRLTPLKMTSPDLLQGASARRFANPYTRLFRDFADRKVKLGPEHMTGGEKFSMAMSMAAAAYAGGAMSAAGGMMNTADRIAAVMRSVTWATTTLQNSLDAQARMLRASEFKIIPVEDPKPEFRTDVFR